VITPQAWIKETETELSDSEVLTLPGGFEPATPKSLAWPRATRLSGQLPLQTILVQWEEVNSFSRWKEFANIKPSWYSESK